jgi:7-cyano-7-deazaguanine synthase
MSSEYKSTAVLLSGGLDSAVLAADALRDGPIVPIYVSVGFAWEAEEREMLAALFSRPPFLGTAAPVALTFDMRDVYPPYHWAVRGTPPAFDSPDEDVYLAGRNIILLSKASVYLATVDLAPSRVLMGQLAGNPFPDATVSFIDAIGRALSLGLGTTVDVETPLARMRKADVIRKGMELGVPLELTLSCMQPLNGLHCGRCSKCRERLDAFREAGVTDPTTYSEVPLR